MCEQIEKSQRVLEEFILLRNVHPEIQPDRKEVVAFATLSAFVQHWPSRSSSYLANLLDQVQDIKSIESSRYITQRRIALAELARFL